MFLAMNRFKITPGFEAGFEKIWRERDSHLSSVPGFKKFSLLKGPVTDEHVLYASHSVWESKEAFQNAESQVQELMSMFKDDIASPPEFKEGEIVWQYLNES